MKITDKQRIDFVQRHKLHLVIMYCTSTGKAYWFVSCDFPRKKNSLPGYTERTWRQAVDKAIKAYMGGKK